MKITFPFMKIKISVIQISFLIEKVKSSLMKIKFLTGKANDLRRIYASKIFPIVKINPTRI